MNVNAVFTGNSLPAGWQTNNWDPITPGGSATVGGGTLTVDGARAGTAALYGPGRTVDFHAIISGDAFEHLGLGTDFSTGSSWAIFSTMNGGALYARTSTGTAAQNQLIPGNWLGSVHDFQINWTATEIKFSIDGAVVADRQVVITNSMRPLIGDLSAGGGTVQVSSMTLAPPGYTVDFSTAPAVPTDWTNTAGTAIAVTGGHLIVDGGSVGTQALYVPGQTLEFSATFSGDPNQHIGFGTDFSNPPFACFSTLTGGPLYAHTSAGTVSQDTLIPGNWLNAPHDFRIDWTASGIAYWIDGSELAFHAVTISASMRPLISDLQPGGAVVSVDSLQLTTDSGNPSITTSQQPASATVGSSIADQATVTGGVSLTGTVTFKLYDNPNAAGAPLFSDTESLVNGVATSAGYTPAATGTVYWVASYNGDGNNIPVTSTAGAEPVTITAATASIGTSPQPASVVVGLTIADQATVTGYHPTGTVTFNLYDNPNATGTPLFTDTESLVNGAATSASYTATDTGTDYWVATYSGDANNNPVTGDTDLEPVTITAAPASISTRPQPASVVVGSTIADQATVTGYHATGTVTFALYDNPDASGIPLFVDAGDPLDANGVATSDGYITNSTGTLYWVVSYSGDDENSPARSDNGAEPVDITPAMASLGTSPQPGTATVGTAIVDQATVTGGFNPTGTVTFNLYDNPNAAGTPLFTSADVPVAASGVATSEDYTAGATGRVYWVVTYNGDGNNIPVTSAADAEPVMITAATPSIDTIQQQNSATVGTAIADQATVTDGFNPAGTVTFKLYGNPNATGTPLFTDTESLVNGVATSAGYTPAATGTVYWVASYNGDGNNIPVTSTAGAEPVTITAATASIGTSPQPASVVVGLTIADQATVTGYHPTGAVTFNLYANSAGSGAPLFSDTEALVNGVATSAGYTATSTGTVYWIASYGGDGNNSAITSAAQPVTVSAVAASIRTSQQPASATVGSVITDQATVTGYHPSGTVTFNLYNNAGATGAPLFTDTESLVNGVATSAGYTATSTGTVYWVARYNGDGNNSAVASGTAMGPVTVTPFVATIGTSPQPATVVVGSGIADRASVTGYHPTGTVTFNLYTNANGTGTPLFTDTESLVTGVATSASYTTQSAGTVYWVATYNGDGNNSTASSSAAQGSVVITPGTPKLAVTKVADRSSIIAGQAAGFTLTITNSGNVADTAVALGDPLPAGIGDIFWQIDTSAAGTTPGNFQIAGSAGSQALALSQSFLSAGDSLAPGQSISVHVTGMTSTYDASSATNPALGAAANYAVLYEGTGGHNLQITNVAVNGSIGVGGTGHVQFSGPGSIAGRLDFAAANAGQFANNNASNVGPASANYGVSTVSSALTTVNALSASLGSLSGTNLAINGTQSINESAGALRTVNGVTYRVFNVTSYSESNGKLLTINGDGSGNPVAFNFAFNSNVNLGGDVALTGGLSDDLVLWNFSTSGKNISLNNNASSYPQPAAFHGIILAPNNAISLTNASFSGRVFGGDSSDLQVVSGDAIIAPTGPLVNTATVSATGVAPQQATATIIVAPGRSVSAGASAGIGYWHNKNGQALINSFNGGSSSTLLGSWLAGSFPNLFGGFKGQTNVQIAADFLTAFGNVGGVQGNTYAQTFAVALAVYATDPTLGGGTAATAQGFTVQIGGTGAATYSVGSNGSALGFVNNSSPTVMQVLASLNANYNPATKQFFGGDSNKTSAANNVTNGINTMGAIANANLGDVGAAYTPDQVRSAYGINDLTLDGTGQTIAIVDAYNNPDIFASLDAFDGQFGTTATGATLLGQYGPAASFLTVLNQTGGSDWLPAADPTGPGRGNWELESALDVEWIHAMAPGAQIVLVEASSQSLSDLMAAVATAAQQPNVSVVSMSWGFAEGRSVFAADEAMYNADLTTPVGHQGVTFVASTGDYGSADPEFPAFSPNVVAVGGTSLLINADSSYNSESGWGAFSADVGTLIGSGGGISQYQPEPNYQTGVQSTGFRTTPDVSLLADPTTGAWVADTYNLGIDNPFQAVGGTSLSAPSWAGLIALANQGRVQAGGATLGSASPTEAQQALYSLPESDFNAVTAGTNGGYNAGPGYNLVAGLGSPVGGQLIPHLVGYQWTDSAPPTRTATISINPDYNSGGKWDTANVMNVFNALIAAPGGQSRPLVTLPTAEVDSPADAMTAAPTGVSAAHTPTAVANPRPAAMAMALPSGFTTQVAASPAEPPDGSARTIAAPNSMIANLVPLVSRSSAAALFRVVGRTPTANDADWAVGGADTGALDMLWSRCGAGNSSATGNGRTAPAAPLHSFTDGWLDWSETADGAVQTGPFAPPSSEDAFASDAKLGGMANALALALVAGAMSHPASERERREAKKVRPMVTGRE